MTPHGAWQAQQREHHAHAQAAYEAQRELAENAERVARAQQELQRAASRALVWSLAGLALCCAFVPSVVGLVLGLKARATARDNDLETPTSATTAMLLGALGIAFGLGVVTLGVLDSRRKAARVATIEVELGDSARAPDLKQRTACLLSEKRLVTEGWEKSTAIDGFECDGRLQAKGDRAVLSGIRFKLSSSPRVLAACLVLGERWSVAGFSTAECSEAEFQPKK
jgi:hypothetical protein